MSARTVLYVLLLVVAAAAAVLSFAALRDLALTCGFAPWLAWLLPVVVDAGAAAGSLVWLGGWSAESARRFARSLALALLGLSVAANALGHGLAAFALAPAWWVVVVVSAVAPAVLGAVVHLAVLVGRPGHEMPGPSEQALDDLTPLHPAIEGATYADLLDEHGLSRLWDQAGPARPRRDRAAELIDAGAGRRRLSRELGITEYEARQLIERTRADDSSTATQPTTDTGQEQDAAPNRAHAIKGAGRTTS